MKFLPGARVLNVDEVAQLIAVLMASDSRHAPVLRGRNSERDPVERDRIRREFAQWVARRLLASNIAVVQGPMAEGTADQRYDTHRYLGCRICGGTQGQA
jgi:hypothetical protein